MTNPNELNINIDADELKKIAKKYKKLKKYMRSSLFQVKKMDGDEKVISELIKDVEGLNDL
tara:strand:- start:393 stop:575 length:183 start_codon:yes stop_codon:yes gene_type:complete